MTPTTSTFLSSHPLTAVFSHLLPVILTPQTSSYIVRFVDVRRVRVSVLVTEQDVVKISDFGTSKELNDKSTKMSFAGTVAWMAPEVITEYKA